MARKRVHQCTEHNVKLCPENKYLVEIKAAKMKQTRSSVSISDAINAIIDEWSSGK